MDRHLPHVMLLVDCRVESGAEIAEDVKIAAQSRREAVTRWEDIRDARRGLHDA
jgi:hypothetical protein